jgi:hypothetical protein
MMSNAILDPSGTYRYWLFRSWDKSLPHVCFCMLNPSTADATCDDPTIRRCIGFAKAWGCGSLSVVNLFAYRATSPKELKLVPDPIGLYNYHFIQQTSHHASMTVAAWGVHGNQLHQGQVVLPMLKNPVCLGLTSAGHPKHPLYVLQDTPLMSYTAVAFAKQGVGSDAVQQQLCQPTCIADDGSM